MALPKPTQQEITIAEEEDDEFLLKKAVPSENPPAPKKRGPVKISIPALRDFEDEDKTSRPTTKKAIAPTNRPTGLLNLLPKPKADQLFQAPPKLVPGTCPKSTTRSLVPHSVAKRKATSTISKPSTSSGPTQPEKKTLPNQDSSDDEAGDGGAVDFFSLATENDVLPQVSRNEINLMVAKRAARFAQNTAKLDRMMVVQEAEVDEPMQVELEDVQQARQGAQELDEAALQSLIGGSRAKRSRIDVDMIEISHEQVMPSREEWLRTSVAGSTQAQVRGQLKDGPKGVAKKKHQITYLAHQAKSNEAELQAIWAANRTTQRQSQSKYGW